MNNPRCGTCYLAKLGNPPDLKIRVCYGLPPTPFLVPGAQGQPVTISARPMVSPMDEACSLYKRKLFFDATDDQSQEDKNVG